MSALILLLTLATADPRVVLVEHQSAGRFEEALAETNRLIRVEPDFSNRYGLHYLKGHLLDLAGDGSSATEAFAEAMSRTPKLAEHARLRIASIQERLNHPEVAAGLTATLLGGNPPRSLVGPATSLLVRTLRDGGDCRLVTGLQTRRFPASERRQLQLVQAECAARLGDADRAARYLTTLLREKETDLVALLAADHLHKLTFRPAPETIELLGRAYHHHRRFDRSVVYLQQIAGNGSEAVLDRRDYELKYSVVRGQFWLGRFDVAAQSYGRLAESSATARQQATALYQRGRSLELAGRWPEAVQSFKQAFVAEPRGSFAGPAVLSAMRLEWRAGREQDALELYRILRGSTVMRSELVRGSVFLLASQLVRGRTDGVDELLRDARSGKGAEEEAAYWQGRQAEINGDLDLAIESYLDALTRNYYHPISQEALRRLRSDRLEGRARVLARNRSSNNTGLFERWILFGDSHPEGVSALAALQRRFERESATRPIVPTSPVAVEAWPIWQSPLVQPEDHLLALGLFAESASVVRKFFPLGEPDLAFTASRELGRSGRVRDGLLIAEILARRIPRRIPDPVVPEPFRQTLYPFAYRSLIVGAAQKKDVDPSLLAALIREESRFDPRATSGASARGLTQFVLPTAIRLASAQGMGPISAEDLEDPKIAITLGAAYLQELQQRFGGPGPSVIAAYNAGEPQAEVWQLHCFSSEPAEYLSKIGFTETRNYTRRVLGSRAQYRDLYD